MVVIFIFNGKNSNDKETLEHNLKALRVSFQKTKGLNYTVSGRENTSTAKDLKWKIPWNG